MSFPPCMFHPVEWVSRTQMAPGVSSLSTTDGTESCLSHSQSWIRFDPKGLWHSTERGRKRDGGKMFGKNPEDTQIHWRPCKDRMNLKINWQTRRWEVSLQAWDKVEGIKAFMSRDKLHSPLRNKCQHTAQHEYIGSGTSLSLCGHGRHIAAARFPTFNRVDIWKPCGFSVSPPGQMIFRWLFITTCSDTIHTCSVASMCWQKAWHWWCCSTVGKHR